MEIDEMKKIWRQQEVDTKQDYSQSEIMMLINNKMLALEKEIKSRDRLEIIACIILIVIFGYYLLYSHSIWIKAGSAVIIFAGIFIWYTLKKNQIKKIDAPELPDHSLKKHLNKELERVKRQKKLSQNIAWWYIAPITAGLFLITIGFETSLLFQIGYMALVLIVALIVWRYNQNTVKHKYDPLISEINKAIDSITESNN